MHHTRTPKSSLSLVSLTWSRIDPSRKTTVYIHATLSRNKLQLSPNGFYRASETGGVVSKTGSLCRTRAKPTQRKDGKVPEVSPTPHAGIDHPALDPNHRTFPRAPLLAEPVPYSTVAFAVSIIMPVNFQSFRMEKGQLVAVLRSFALVLRYTS